MKIRGGAALIAGAAMLLAGCSSDDGPMSDDEFYEQMQVGDFADYSEGELDTAAKGMCSDLSNLDEDDRSMAVLVLRQSVETEEEAFQVGQAMTGRWCPEYADAFDY